MEDGLVALQRELSITAIARLIERTARWVDPETFRLLPLWYPEYGRGAPFYNKNWSEPRYHTRKRSQQKVHKPEGNSYANQALSLALGITKAARPHWSCCHIWGLDDPKYQKANTVIADRRFYSCVGNMLLLPSPLKAFTDLVPQIKTMLRVCASQLYGWSCDHGDIADTASAVSDFSDWAAYPDSWPRPGVFRRPCGVVELNDAIRKCAQRRVTAIASDLAKAGPYYPRDEVREALAYWNVDVQSWSAHSPSAPAGQRDVGGTRRLNAG